MAIPSDAANAVVCTSSNSHRVACYVHADECWIGWSRNYYSIGAETSSKLTRRKLARDWTVQALRLVLEASGMLQRGRLSALSHVLGRRGKGPEEDKGRSHAGQVT